MDPKAVFGISLNINKGIIKELTFILCYM
uniref:Uncharacterized protein n=1 Tax=Phytophthora nicotianae TaxID=4792 RepID=G9CPW4_PHYNI|nr:hypothetical protein [Phytophthora nicotianae]